MKNPITTMSRERLEALIDDEDCRATVEEQETLAAFMLAVMDAKPEHPQRFVVKGLTNAYDDGNGTEWLLKDSVYSAIKAADGEIAE